MHYAAPISFHVEGSIMSSSAANIVSIHFDKKLTSMIVLTALVVVPVCSILDKNLPINLEKEFIRFLNIWFFLGLSTLFWNIFLGSNPQYIGLILIIKTAWCMGLLSSFLIFLNNIEFMMQVAVDHWGNWAGPFLVLSFSVIWLYTIFNFYNQPRDRAYDHVQSVKSPISIIPKETQYVTVVVMMITGILTFFAYKGIIPNFGELVATFLKIWLTWLIMFGVCYYYLFKENKFPGLLHLDLEDLTWVKIWDCFMMTAIISFFITAYGSVGHLGHFDMMDYYLFWLGLLAVAVFFIKIFRWLGD